MLEVKKVLMISLLVSALTFVCLLPSGEAGEGKDFDKSVLLEARLKQQEESWNSPTSTVYSPEVVVKDMIIWSKLESQDDAVNVSFGFSGCFISICIGSGCFGSVCLGSSCLGSYCLGTGCIASGCMSNCHSICNTTCPTTCGVSCRIGCQ